MLSPQVLYTAVEREVVVAMNFLLPAPPCHQRPPPQKAAAAPAGAHFKSCRSGGAASGSADRDTDHRKRAAEGDRKLPADDGRKRRADSGLPGESDPTGARRDK